MAVVILMFCLLALSVIVVVLLRGYRSQEIVNVTTEMDGQQFLAVPLGLAFDPEYAIIWDTQLPALELISASGKRGVAIHNLFRCYRKDACHYPELYDGSTFRSWIQFLESAQLITCTHTRVVLTRDGQEFLHFRVVAPELVASSTRGPER